MDIRQGDVYWIDLGEPSGSEPAYRRPHVVVQNDVFNASPIRTAVVCALTTNVRRAKAPGNVLLMPGEGNLPEESVVNVSQLFTVDKRELTDYVGTLSAGRMREVAEGIALVTEPRGLGGAVS